MLVDDPSILAKSSEKMVAFSRLEPVATLPARLRVDLPVIGVSTLSTPTHFDQKEGGVTTQMVLAGFSPIHLILWGNRLEKEIESPSSRTYVLSSIVTS